MLLLSLPPSLCSYCLHLFEFIVEWLSAVNITVKVIAYFFMCVCSVTQIFQLTDPVFCDPSVNVKISPPRTDPYLNIVHLKADSVFLPHLKNFYDELFFSFCSLPRIQFNHWCHILVSFLWQIKKERQIPSTNGTIRVLAAVRGMWEQGFVGQGYLSPASPDLLSYNCPATTKTCSWHAVALPPPPKKKKDCFCHQHIQSTHSTKS